MAKDKATYKKTGVKRAKRGKQPAQKSSRSVEVTTRPLFDQAEIVKGFATLVLAAHEGSEEEKARLKSFITKMDGVQASIQQACKELDMGGNPMYRSFTIKA